jgi:glycosyltransferase involved in cell wall biosynthesis
VPEIGGPATHTALLQRFLPAHGVEVFTVPFRAVRYLPPVIRHFAYAFIVARQARRERVDVILAQDVCMIGLPALLAAKLLRVPFIVRCPGDYAWEEGQQRFGVREDIIKFQTRRYGWRVELLRTIQRLVCRAANLVVTPSRWFRDIVSAWGVPADRLRVIYNGIEAVPQLVDAPRRQKLIVSSGRHVRWKGFETLIEAMSALPGWKLVLIGDGPQRKALELAAERHAVAGRVEFTGELSRAEVFKWFGAASCFVLNTAFESFSYQVVEALAAGVPVVTTSCCALPEIVVDDVHGRIIPYSAEPSASLIDTITSVETDPAAWSRRVTAGRLRAQELSAEATAAAFAQAIFSLSGHAVASRTRRLQR